MSIRYSKKLEKLPRYVGGMDLERARQMYEASDVIKLASNEAPWGPHPAVLDAVAAAAADANRYPDQHESRLRTALAKRFDYDPAGIAVSNGSCEILLAASLALCEEGDEIVYGWPAFSMYPQLAPLSGAREIRVDLDGYEHDLDAMAAEITVATQLVLVCNPNNPTGTHHPAERIAAFLEKVPAHVTVILDEAYIEFQANDDVDTTVDLLADHPNLVLLRTFSKVYGLAGFRCGYALGSAGFRSAVDAVRQPFSVNLLAQTAATEALRHGDEVESRIDRTIVERVIVEEGVRDLGLKAAQSQTNFIWIQIYDQALPGADPEALDAATAREAEVVEALGKAGVIVRPGTPLGGPGHIRVTFGTPEENQRFLAALADLL